LWVFVRAYWGLPLYPHVMQTQAQIALGPGKSSTGRQPAAIITSAARSAVTRCQPEQVWQPFRLCRSCSMGDPSVPQSVHRHRHGTLLPG
jgi:hypothetical protein